MSLHAKLSPSTLYTTLHARTTLAIRNPGPDALTVILSAECADARLVCTFPHGAHFILHPGHTSRHTLACTLHPMPADPRPLAFTVHITPDPLHNLAPLALHGTLTPTAAPLPVTLAARMNWRILAMLAPFGLCLCLAGLLVNLLIFVRPTAGLVPSPTPPATALALSSPTLPAPATARASPTASPVVSGTVSGTPQPAAPTSAPLSATLLAPTTTTSTVTNLPMLDLPFPYNGSITQFGGTRAQFCTAFRTSTDAGRVLTWFDHLYPLDRAEATLVTTSTQTLLLYDGTVSSTLHYSGHSGYDFSVSQQAPTTTPVFAAADGTLVATGDIQGALYVLLKHTVPGVGDFLTLYRHLAQDKYYQAMQKTELGTRIPAGTHLGTMGNTGFSTGSHLHFEVGLDTDHDGELDPFERVDPSGFSPSPTYPTYPWVQYSTHHQVFQLWRYPPSACK